MGRTGDMVTPAEKELLLNACVYKITDLDTGQFYIGSCIHKDRFLSGTYSGSGSLWYKHWMQNKLRHRFSREIIYDSFSSLQEMYELEREEIVKYCKDSKIDHSTGCMNIRLESQKNVCCPECGKIGYHSESCSKYVERSICPECSCKSGKHKKFCSYYRKPADRICIECGGVNSNHKPWCGKIAFSCQECGGVMNHHKSSCSKYSEGKTCPECGGRKNYHRKSCSKYTTPICEECGAGGGKHKNSCSKSKGCCPECGYSLQSRRHSKSCSRYKKPRKPDPCSECGCIGAHNKSCGKCKQPKPCEECGGIKGHFDFCSKSRGKCPECGYSLKSNRHAKDCPRSIKTKDLIREM